MNQGYFILGFLGVIRLFFKPFITEPLDARGTVYSFIKKNIFFTGLQYKVKCSEDLMEVELIKSATVKEVHLQHLKQFPGMILHLYNK